MLDMNTEINDKSISKIVILNLINNLNVLHFK